ncbi:gamma-glutamylcyclotransferase family protein [Streptomyces gamaensis]|uniref:Gamma-glutamylcyclotransferase family protein n=1 Tax=Streptomyces gamaensis TaxID=1763542 RepID=A0ABW0Z529_9ACTN
MTTDEESRRGPLPVFVYGTLRPGQGNHGRYLAGRTAAEEPAVLRGAVLYEGPGFPYAVEEPGGEVHGELVTLDPERWRTLLAALDALEDYVPGRARNHYVRVERPVVRGDGVTVRAWVYVAARPLARRLAALGVRVPGGSWPTGREGR